MSAGIPAAAVWTLGALPEALAHLGRGRLGGSVGPLPPVPVDGDGDADDDAVDGWLAAAADRSSLDVQRVAACSSDVDALLRGAAPMIARIGRSDRYVVAVRTGRRVRLLRRDLGGLSVGADVLADALRAPAEAAHADVADRAVARLPERRRDKARRLVLRSVSAADRVGACWLLRPPPYGSAWRELAAQGVPVAVAGWVGSHLAAYALWVGSWIVVGRGALDGRLEPGWLLGWAVILVSAAPLRALTVWLQGAIAVRAGVVLKQRLLIGALRMTPDEARAGGGGTLLGRVEESATLERLALDGGLAALLALVEWFVATGLLWAAGARIHAALGAVWLAAIVLLARRMHRDRRRATQERVASTHDLVEKLLGHRTRAVQEPPAERHAEEDEALERYGAASRGADRWSVALSAVTSGWTFAGVLALAPSFVAGTATPGSLAVAIGGVLLVSRALDALARGLDDLVGAAIAWEQVRDVAIASYRAPRPAAPEAASVPAPRPEDPVLEARGLGFRYPVAHRPVLAGVDARIGRRDRILLQGASGGGKSTFAAMALGLRDPTAGTLLLDGLDRHAWGDAGWRARVSGAPQFHENHVLAGTLAFNLLLGRRWPPTPADLDDAERVCAELGLGPLLDRMPARLQQLVGETGWQLSHGERSRVYLARALLQNSALIVLDESFGALDAQATEWCLYRANNHRGALIVVAHP